MYKKSLGKLPSALLACLRSALMTILGLHRVWRLREPTSSSDWLFTAELISNTTGPCYMEVLSNLIGRCSLTLGYKGPRSWFRDKEDWVWNPEVNWSPRTKVKCFFQEVTSFFWAGGLMWKEDFHWVGNQNRFSHGEIDYLNDSRAELLTEWSGTKNWAQTGAPRRSLSWWVHCGVFKKINKYLHLFYILPMPHLLFAALFIVECRPFI